MWSSLQHSFGYLGCSVLCSELLMSSLMFFLLLHNHDLGPILLVIFFLSRLTVDARCQGDIEESETSTPGGYNRRNTCKAILHYSDSVHIVGCFVCSSLRGLNLPAEHVSVLLKILETSCLEVEVRLFIISNFIHLEWDWIFYIKS